MKSLVIGAGQVGTGLFDIIRKYYPCYMKDVEPMDLSGVEVLHVAYPDHPDFVKTTKAYIQQYRPVLTIIHSSVPLGTTDQCGEHVVYSPVRGRHPNLAAEMRSFKKFVCGKDKADVELTARYLRACGWETFLSDNPTDGEFIKLFSNVHMGIEIAVRQEVERMLKAFNVDPRIYEEWEDSYNAGYMKLGQVQMIRSRMRPDPIGGHCILPCTEILREQFPSKILDFVLESNDKKKQEMYGTPKRLIA